MYRDNSIQFLLILTSINIFVLPRCQYINELNKQRGKKQKNERKNEIHHGKQRKNKINELITELNKRSMIKQKKSRQIDKQMPIQAYIQKQKDKKKNNIISILRSVFFFW